MKPALFFAGGLLFLLVFHGSGQPQEEGNEAYRQHWLGNETESVRHFENALKGDSAFPYRWSDLGEALLNSGDSRRALYCFERARQLAPKDPQISLRAANFYFRTGHPDEALRIDSAILRQLPDYDETIFSYFVRMGGSLPEVLAIGVGQNSRAAAEFYRFLEARGNERATDTAWKWLADHNLVTRPLALSRTTALLNRGRSPEAREVWMRFVSSQNDIVTDPGFETPWSGEGFDWRIEPTPGVTVEADGRIAHSGTQSLQIRFHSDANLDFHHVSQRVWLTPGHYVLSAWVRTEALSTDEGIGLRVAGAQPPKPDAATETLQGTHDWTRLQTEFAVGPAPRLARIEIFRRPSLRFDSKPQGTAWIDDVRVAPIP